MKARPAPRIKPDEISAVKPRRKVRCANFGCRKLARWRRVSYFAIPGQSISVGFYYSCGEHKPAEATR